MNVLEKILEELENPNNYTIMCGKHFTTVDRAREIIRAHMDEVPAGWIPVSERLPETDDYILISFDNASFIDIGRYEKDEDGSGAFYPGDEDKSYSSIGIFVNAWRPLPEPYKEETENDEM